MLMRFDPFRELDRRTQPPGGQTPPTWAMAPYRRNGDFVVNFDLPGVDPATIDLTVEKNVLTVTAERGFARSEGDEVVVAERPQGKFSRQLFLGESLDPDHIRANYEQGVLTLHIPVAEKAKPRKVEVTTGGEPAVEVLSSAS